MNVVWIVQWLGAAPDDGKCCGQIWRARRVHELHGVTVDGVAQQLSIYTCDTALDVELAHKARLNDELTDDVHFDTNGLLTAGRHENLTAVTGGIDGGTKAGTTTIAGPNAIDASDENVVAAIFGRVVRAPMCLNTPIARELGRHAARARGVRRTVKEGEVCRDQVRSGLSSH